MAETALVVLVPEAEPLVASHRLRHDPSAARGVPAHVTILYPFRSELDEGADNDITDLADGVIAFDVEFAAVSQFPGGVVYLAPSPSEPFLRLIAAAMRMFPDCPPYSGTISDPIPHLTVADGVDALTAATLDRALRPGLPVTARIERLTLIGENAAGRWNVLHHWSLG